MTPEAILIETCLHIVSKDGEKVPFILNAAQREYDDVRTRRDIILKARQEGFSSFIDAVMTVECMSRDNIRCVLLAHDRESTEKIFDRVRFYIQHMRGGLKPDPTRASRREFYFKKRNSSFFIGTAGNVEFGRGDTVHRLHLSEVASFPDPGKLAAGVLESVPKSGHIWLESTAKGRGNWFHGRCMRAVNGTGSYKLHFFPWFKDPEYSVPARMAEDELTEDERALRDEFGLTMEQIQWYRDKNIEMDESDSVGGANLFQQEYPSTIDGAFLASGMSVFRIVPMARKEPVFQDRFLTVWERPNKDRQYTIGVDVSAGVGGDRSVICGLDCETFEQVFEWASDCVDPDELAHYVADLARDYNTAMVAPELNNHGLATIESLRRIYPVGRILQRYQYDHREAVERTDQLGWLTTQKSKSQMITSLRKALRHGLKVYSEPLKSELSTFVQKDSGALEAQDGCYDDRVIACALSVVAYKHCFYPARVVIQETREQFSFNVQRQLAVKQFVSRNGSKPSVIYQRPDTGFVN